MKDGTRAIGPGPGKRGSPTGADASMLPPDGPVAGRLPGRCWRCGVPFAWTTAETLAACTALARAGTGGAA